MGYRIGEGYTAAAAASVLAHMQSSARGHAVSLAAELRRAGVGEGKGAERIIVNAGRGYTMMPHFGIKEVFTVAFDAGNWHVLDTDANFLPEEEIAGEVKRQLAVLAPWEQPVIDDNDN